MLDGIVIPIPHLGLAILEGPLSRSMVTKEQISIGIANRLKPGGLLR